jgi:hypothetical protein
MPRRWLSRGSWLGRWPRRRTTSSASSWLNEATLADNDGDFSDWVELCNYGNAAVNGWF